MPIKGITLIELLVVIAMIGVLAGVVGPNISGWNCRQEVRNDFERINGFLETVRLEAVNRNKTMMAYYSRNGYLRAYQVSKACQVNTSSVSTNIPDLVLDKKNKITTQTSPSCFYADGSSEAGFYIISRQCGTKNYKFKSQLFSATGFIEKLKYNTTTSNWDEL